MKEIKMQTLTPIWTGNIQQNSDQIKDTSLVGSLRWWHEAIVRKFGGNPCDPTASSCSFDFKKYKKNKKIKDGLKDICSVCELFGCTGYSRRFRLNVDQLKSVPLFFVSHENVYLSNGNWLYRTFGGKKHGKGKNTFFSFKKEMLFSSKPFLVNLKTLYEDHDLYSGIYFLLWFISEFGGLGAKTQNGFGQVKMKNISNKLLKQGKRYIEDHVKIKEPNENHAMFNINDFFSIEFEIEDKNPYYRVGKEIGDPKGFDYKKYFIPCAFDIRYKMRSKNPFTKMGENWGMRLFLWKKLGANKKAKQKTNDLLGDQYKKSSRMFVSHLFKEDPKKKFRIRVWGFVPNSIEKKEKIKKLVADYICDKRTFYGARLKKEYKEKEVFG